MPDQVISTVGLSTAVARSRLNELGPNAVVTQDVPSHDTVVVEKRRKDRPTVVNV